MKKILFVHGFLSHGGAERILLNYLKILAKNPNYQIDLLLREDHVTNVGIEEIPNNVNVSFLLNKIETQYRNYLHWEKDKPENAAKKGSYESWYNYICDETFKRFRDYINNSDYDLVVNFCLYLDDCLHRYQLNKPIVRWTHHDNHLEHWFAQSWWYENVLSQHVAYVNICEDMHKKCQDYLVKLNFGDKRTELIYNPLFIDEIREKANANIGSDRIGSDKALLEDNFILQVSRLDEIKNHIQMVDIYAKLKQKGIKEKLYIIGDGQCRVQIQNRINELGLENDCLLLGARDNPFPFMQKAKLFIHTSLGEGLPTVLIESMICGTPVVSMDCPTGPKEILQDGLYGELVPLQDGGTFVEKTYELLTNEEKRQHFISLLPEAVQRFDANIIANQVFNLFDELLANK